MTIEKVKKYKRGLGSFIRSEKGQRFFNFAYSIGAAVVIWGALFKILNIHGGNVLLSVGMGTEVLMFILTAFDRPPKEYRWEDVFPALKGTPEGAGEAPEEVAEALQGNPHLRQQGVVGIPADMGRAVVQPAVSGQTDSVSAVEDATKAYIDRLASVAADMDRLHAVTSTLAQASETLLESFRAITENSAAISESSHGYVTQMQNLDRNIAGLNTIYEVQLRGVSSQVDAIDRVNRGIKDMRDMYEKSAAQSVRYCEETERMARYMQQLNSIYERMVEAMTVNMYRPGMPPQEAGRPSAQGPDNR